MDKWRDDDDEGEKRDEEKNKREYVEGGKKNADAADNDSGEQRRSRLSSTEGDQSDRRIKNRDTERHVFVIWNLGILGFILTNVDKKIYIYYTCV